MKITATAHFSANGIKAYPGKILSAEEIVRVSNVLHDLKTQSLVEVEEFVEPGMKTSPEKEVKEEPEADPIGLASTAKELQEQETKSKGKKNR